MDLMGMMGKLKATQQRIEETKKLAEQQKLLDELNKSFL